MVIEHREKSLSDSPPDIQLGTVHLILMLPEPLIGKCPSGTRLDVFFKVSSLALIDKSVKGNNFPGAILGGVGRLTGIVRGESCVKG
jgi:hypothetical protein